ncbi:unnamed protein product [Allacma fusca]|uniref:Uncharacterized protein n=1 Tax=Allacma fusca TaxID=39272 RepID=A0A8J2P562_9HEXA|nr:unnamed protein product [Allacma fusca]
MQRCVEATQKMAMTCIQFTGWHYRIRTKAVVIAFIGYETWDPLENFSIHMLADIINYENLVLEHCRMKNFTGDCSNSEAMYLSYTQEPSLKDRLLSYVMLGIDDLRRNKELLSLKTTTDTPQEPMTISADTQTESVAITLFAVAGVRHTCPQYPIKFATRFILNRHIRLVHSTTNTMETCTHCDLELKHVDGLT